jgi:cell cycle arrest protein BUB3
VNAPLDSTSALEFTKTKDKNLLIVSSWDKTIKLYDTSTNKLLLDSEHSASLLDCCWLNDNHGNTAFCAGLAKTLSMVDFSTGTSKDLGTHDEAIRCVKHCEANGSVITGSWDKSIKQWDFRNPNAETGHFAQPNKVFFPRYCV